MIVCICSVTFMLLLTVCGMAYFRMQIASSTDILNQDTYKNYEHYFVMITSDNKSEFWNSVYEGARANAEQHNAYVEMLGNNLNREYSEDALLRIAIDSEVDGIILEANETEKTRALIDEAVDQGIAVITVLKDSPSSKRKSYVGISSYNLGQEYGGQVNEIVRGRERGKGEENPEAQSYTAYVLMDANAEDGSQNTVYTGIQEAINQDASVSELVKMEAIPISGASAFSAEEAIRDIFMSTEELPDIIICMNENNTSCVYQALVDYNQVGNIDVVGYYNSPNILSGIAKNIIYSTVDIDTQAMGNDSVEALIEYIETGYVSDYYTVDTSLISSENVDTYLGGDVDE